MSSKFSKFMGLAALGAAAAGIALYFKKSQEDKLAYDDADDTDDDYFSIFDEEDTVPVKEKVTETVQAAADAAEDLAETIKEKAQDTAQDASSLAEDAAKKVKEAAKETADNVKEAAKDAKEAMEDVQEATAETVQKPE
ncbi:MAG: hypothetical protein ACOYBE_07535 [Blautia sp.]|jgi:methyl-accepting chemotaxis protein